MILRSIELENFGLYAGRQTLDLAPRGRPVVLVGGRNGAGKTTLLDAVRLALYGRRAMGSRVALTSYEEHLRRRIHLGDGDQPAQAAVGLEFDYTEDGRVYRYRVERRWLVKSNRVNETLSLEKDGETVAKVPRDEWQNFLQELVPPGVSQLFFFDGEKIAEIAQDGPDEGLAEAVRSLLGVELVESLQTDLGLFLARHAAKENRAAAKRYEACIRELSAVNDEIAEVAEDVEELRSVHAGHERQVLRIRQKFVAEGGDAASQKVSLEAAKSEVQTQIARRHAELKELANGLLPFAVAPRLIDRFAGMLERSADLGRAQALKVLSTLVADWKEGNRPLRTANWSKSHWDDLDLLLSAASRSASDETLKWLEVGERASLLSRLAEVSDDTRPRARLLAQELDADTNRLRGIEAELVRAAGEATGMVFEELNQAELQLASADAQLKARSEELRTLELRKTALQREKRKLEEAQNDARDEQGRVSLAQRVGAVLQRYEEQLLDLKIAQLKLAFVERFNHLSRKESFVSDVRIDRSSFDAVLIDAKGRELHKSSLSAGEKQVYAIAMLWALAKTSGRHLPMIIDTPLARLDTEHRSALVERYFPEASHQVIVLSTDTEIDSGLLAQLGPHISHSFRLDYDHKQRATRINAGYFAEDGEADSALQQA